MVESMRWDRKIGEGMLADQNGKENGNENSEGFFWLLKIRNLIQIIFDLKIIQNICKWDLVLFISLHRIK
jgi:hypothetical protein